MHIQNRFWGTTLLVSGTTIGAGMLALPLSIHGLGLVWGSIVLAFFWLVMTGAAFMGLKVALSQPRTYPINRLLSVHYGPWANVLVTLVCLALFWSLLAAYLAGMTSLSFTYDSWVPFKAGQIALALGLGLMVIISLPMQWIDIINRILMIAKGGFFIALLLSLVTQINFSQLAYTVIPPFSWKSSLWAFPIFFSAFGFHGSIHSFIGYGQRQFKMLCWAFIIGGFIPLIIYLIWVWSSLGALISQAVILNTNADLGQFVQLLTRISSTPWMGFSVWGFSLLAIMTSAIGVGIGLKDLWSETLVNMIRKGFINQLVSLCLTFLLPIGIASIFPGAFVPIIRFAAIFLSFIAIIFPFMIFVKLKPNLFTYLAAILLFLVGVGIIVVELTNIFVKIS